MRLTSLPRSIGRQKVLLRLDLNVPLAAGKISDDYKIREALPTIQRLAKAPLIVATHLGEPAATNSYRFAAEFSLAPVAQRMADLLQRPVTLVGGTWSEINACAAALQPGEIMLLENLRFWPGETANDAVFAKRLAALADVYVNDAFAVSHRRHASVSAIKKYLPSYAGPALSTECRKLEAVRRARGPLVVVMGGAKISSKEPLIKKFLPRAECILIGGGLANDMLLAQGYEIGKSYHESGHPASSLPRSPKICLPQDLVVVSGKKGARPRPRVKAAGELSADEIIVDIGPATAREFARRLRTARCIIWNGPMGIFEKKYAQAGTRAIVMALAAAHRRGLAVSAGGGETVAAIQLFRPGRSLSWETAGGGASLAFLAGQSMPGLEGLTG